MVGLPNSRREEIDVQCSAIFTTRDTAVIMIIQSYLLTLWQTVVSMNQISIPIPLSENHRMLAHCYCLEKTITHINLTQRLNSTLCASFLHPIIL